MHATRAMTYVWLALALAIAAAIAFAAGFVYSARRGPTVPAECTADECTARAINNAR